MDNMAALFPESEMETRPVPADQDAAAAEKLRELARDLQGAMTNTVEKYMAVCQHIRDAQMMPVQVKKELAALGFADSRISEVNRVAQVSDEVWAQYKSRVIGFKMTLELARAEKAVETAKKAAEEAARNPSLFPAENAPETKETAPEAKPETKPEPEPDIWKKWGNQDGKKASAKSTQIDKTKVHKPVAAPAKVDTPYDMFERHLAMALPDARDCGVLHFGLKSLKIFDVKGWQVEVRITRKKQTKKASKKPATKSKKQK